MPESAPLVAVLVALAGTAIGFLVRGQIRGSSADKLWDVAEKLREEQAEEIRELKAESRESERRITDLEKAQSVAEALAEQLKVANDRLQATIAQKDDHIERLQRDNRELLARLK